MSINLPGTQSQQTAGASEQVAREEAVRQTASARSNPFGSISNGARLTGQSVPENAGSETFNKLLENMQKVLKDSPEAAGTVLIPLYKEESRMPFSAIAVVRTNKTPVSAGWRTQDYVVAQIMLVEATGEIPRSYTDDSIRNRAVQVILTTDDAYNSAFQAMARKKISEQLNFQGVVVLIDCLVLRRAQDVEDKNIVLRLVSAMTTATNTRALSRHPEFNDWNLVKWVGNERREQLPVTVETTSDEVLTTANGDVVHADMSVTVHIESRGENNRRPEFDGTVGSEIASQALIAMELVPVEPKLLNDSDMNSGRGRRRDRDFIPQAAWMPRANIVHIEQMVARTTAGILLPIATAAELNNRRQWATVYRPRRSVRKDEVNFYDVGALNIDANLFDEDGDRGTPIDTAKSTFDDKEFGVLLDRTMTQDMAIGLDCPDSGPTAYYTAPFAALALGDRDAKERAINDIVNSANDLTNGAFGSLFDPRNDRILELDPQRFYMGYWTDNNQQKRDIRQLASFLPIANMVASQVATSRLMDDWLDTVLGVQDENARMAEQLKILNALTDNSVVITGKGVRVTLSSAFVGALVEGIAKTNAPLVARNTDVAGVVQQKRVVANLGSGALISSRGVSRQQDSGRGRSYSSFRRYD